jgi:hypothetical protein
MRLTCEVCGKEFSRRGTKHRGRRTFCSRPCMFSTYRGAGNPKWRGGRITEPTGRVLVYAPGHPNATLMGGTHAYEYRLIASEMLGRPLADGEIVHHINGDCTDNRPENLRVMTQSEHVKAHGMAGGNKKPRIVKTCMWCKATFSVQPFKESIAKYCSRTCAMRSILTGKPGRNTGGRHALRVP